MMLRPGMTVEEFEKQQGRKAQPIGEDVRCRCCRSAAPRHIGFAPSYHGVGLVPNTHGWLVYIFPLDDQHAGVAHEHTYVCPTCAPELLGMLEHLRAKKGGENTILDEDLLCDDVSSADLSQSQHPQHPTEDGPNRA